MVKVIVQPTGDVILAFTNEERAFLSASKATQTTPDLENRLERIVARFLYEEQHGYIPNETVGWY